MYEIHIPAEATEADLEAAYAKGLLRKEQLVDGAYYLGHCRNAQIARWSAPAQQFVYRRAKFNQSLIEYIPHPADESRFDVFVAVERVEPTAEQVIEDSNLAPAGPF